MARAYAFQSLIEPRNPARGRVRDGSIVPEPTAAVWTNCSSGPSDLPDRSLTGLRRAEQVFFFCTKSVNSSGSSTTFTSIPTTSVMSTRSVCKCSDRCRGSRHGGASWRGVLRNQVAWDQGVRRDRIDRIRLGSGVAISDPLKTILIVPTLHARPVPLEGASPRRAVRQFRSTGALRKLVSPTHTRVEGMRRAQDKVRKNRRPKSKYATGFFEFIGMPVAAPIGRVSG